MVYCVRSDIELAFPSNQVIADSHLPSPVASIIEHVSPLIASRTIVSDYHADLDKNNISSTLPPSLSFGPVLHLHTGLNISRTHIVLSGSF